MIPTPLSDTFSSGQDQPYRPRAIEASLKECLADTPVVVITGPRQSGKTTLARELLKQIGAGSYHTLDDENVLTVAQTDPVGFLRQQQALQGGNPSAPLSLMKSSGHRR